ncbi:hypothetical protein [Streptomyces torulosus]|uniref:hypothetical protein n=1 Tax=Streptomyces torulosus TaxID=68276 RepID=UPI0006EB81FA|nr:hypothetical protein [Streptomyces torulosus]
MSRAQDLGSRAVQWVRDELLTSGCVETVRARTRTLADEAHWEALKEFDDSSAPTPRTSQFLLDLPYYMVERAS